MRVRGARGLEAVSVFLGILELQRVFGDLGQRQHLEACIQQQREPCVGPDPSVMLAFRADRHVRLVIGDEQHLLT